MGYFQVRCDSRVVNYDRKGFIRLATGFNSEWNKIEETNGFNLCLACSLATSIQTCKILNPNAKMIDS